MSPSESSLTCPNCGDALALRLQRSKVVGCASCGSTVFLNDRSFRAPGEQGEMHDAPGLLQLGQTVRLDDTTVTPVGVIRYSYGRGWWDEFWCDGPKGGLWVSVDEGDIVIEEPTENPGWSPKPDQIGMKVGESFTHGVRTYTAVEAETATCVAYRGELPEAPEVGEMHYFTNFLSGPSKSLSLEIWGSNHAWFSGQWIDPWQVKAS